MAGESSSFNRWSRSIIGRLSSPTVEHTIWLGSSYAVNGIAGALSTAILARFLGVAEFGVYSLVISLLVMLTDVSDLGISSAMVRFGSASVAEGNQDQLRAVVSIFTRWKMIAGGSVLLISALFLNQIVAYLFQHVDPAMTSYFQVSLIAVALGVVAGIFPPIYQSFKQFRTYSVLLSSRHFLKLMLIVLCVFAMARYSVALLLWVEIITIALFIGCLYWFSPFKRFSLAPVDKKLQHQLFSFNRWISLYQAITLVGGRLDVVFIGGLSTAQALGNYSAGAKVIAMMTMVTSAYMTVLLSEMSSSLSHESMGRKVRSSFMVVLALVLGVGAVALVANPLVSILFGTDFAGSGGILQIMCIGTAFTVLAYPLNAVLFALDKSFVFPLVAAASVLAGIVGNVILIPKYGAGGAAMSFAVSSGVAFLVSSGFFLKWGRSFVINPITR